MRATPVSRDKGRGQSPIGGMQNIRIICLDLDGTLLDNQKRISKRNARALQAAADAGIEIVPTTGRFYLGIPEQIRNLPFIHYAITINGACVYDVMNSREIVRIEIPADEAVSIMEHFDTLDVMYDCFLDSWGYMNTSWQEHPEKYSPDPAYTDVFKKLRSPVPELKEFVRASGKNIQKVQFWCRDLSIRDKELKLLPKLFTNVAVSSAIYNNVEVNNVNAHKGEALRRLCEYTDTDPSEVMAIGDGSNDLSMLEAAGTAVAMGNAVAPVLAAANIVTDTNEADGVAKTIEQLLGI